jgi:hypothetical protein
MLAHRVARGRPDDDSRQLALIDPNIAGAVACPLRAGGCTMHFEGTPHFTGGNRTEGRHRRAYIFNLRPAGTGGGAFCGHSTSILV